jgi:rhodanese-related sulfurtransferase
MTLRALATPTVLLMLALALTACAPPGPEMSAPAARAEVEAGRLTLIDIRTPQEWRQTGIAADAYRVDMRHPAGDKGFVGEVLALTGGDRTAPIGLICRTGNRSSGMQRVLIKAGFTHVYNVREGMAGSGAGPGWARRGLPVTPCPPC